MKKKIVLHIVQSPGGVERYLKVLLKYIDSNKYDNILVCTKEYNVDYFTKYVKKVETVDLVREINTIKDLRAILKLRRLIKWYAPDIIYCHSSKAGAVGRIANIGLPFPCIYNPHGWAFNMKASRKKILLYRFVEKCLAKVTTKIVCISEYEKQSAIRNGVCQSDKIVVINNGIDVNEFSGIVNDEFERKTVGKYVVGMVGRISSQKAPDIFVKAARIVKDAIPNALFVIVGSGEEEKEIRKLIKRNELEESFLITGWVEDPLTYISRFDMGVLLSRWEGFGLVLAEYMLCRVPIVATRVDAIPEVVKDHESGLLVEMDDYESAASAIIKIYSHPELQEKLRNNGVQNVYENYTAERMAKETEELIDIVLEENPGK